MIRKLRCKFIIVCMISYLIVFGSITAFFITDSIRRNVRSIDLLTDLISDNGGLFPEASAAVGQARNRGWTGRFRVRF